MTDQRIPLLDQLGAEFARVACEHEPKVSRSRRGPRHRTALSRRSLALAASAVLLLSGGAYVVPTTRAAIDDLTGSFAGWVAGDDEQAPGRALRPADDAPDWVRETGGRLIAETGDVGLYVTRTKSKERGTLLSFALDNDVLVFDSIDGWRERFDEHAVVLLGSNPETDDRGRFPVLGVTARSVDRVELRYATGPPLAADRLKGGFVLLADGDRPLREIVAYNATDRELDRTDVRHVERNDP